MFDNYVVLLGTKGGPAIRPGSSMPTSNLVRFEWFADRTRLRARSYKRPCEPRHATQGLIIDFHKSPAF